MPNLISLAVKRLLKNDRYLQIKSQFDSGDRTGVVCKLEDHTSEVVNSRLVSLAAKLNKFT